MNYSPRSHWTLAMLVGVLALFASAAVARADAREELKARFKARYPALAEAKDAGKIGETHEGFVESVDGSPDDKAKELIANENGDRRELYKMIAQSENITPEQVARLNAQRRFEREPAGHFLKGPDGAWKKKG